MFLLRVESIQDILQKYYTFTNRSTEAGTCPDMAMVNHVHVNSQIREREEQIKQLKEEIDRHKRPLTNSRILEFNDEIKRLNDEIKRLKDEIKALREEVSELHKRLDELASTTENRRIAGEIVSAMVSFSILPCNFPD